ncbi:MAG: ATP-dependent helicase/nuclease subunit A, partial [Myxococcota bacterium]
VDPVFGIVADGAFGTLYGRAFDAWFQATLAAPPEGVRRLLRRTPAKWGETPRDVLRDAGWRLIDRRDFAGGWRRPDGFSREEALDSVLPRLADLAAYRARAYNPDDNLTRTLRDVERVVDELAAREKVAARDYDGVEAQLASLRRKLRRARTGWGRDFGQGLSRDEVKSALADATAALNQVLDHADADLAAVLREDLRPLVAGYEALKERSGDLDFLDLLVRARNLLRDDARVRKELQQRFARVFVDEFQDTDPLQAEILLLLSADDPACSDWRAARPVPGKLFVVGDPKQSIYRFRRADVALYAGIKQQLADQGARVVQLSTSFRSTPSIQQVVNASFEPLMQGGPSQAGYVPLHPFRPEAEGQPSVIALPVPRPYGRYNKVYGSQVDLSLPGAVGAMVHWLVKESGWTVQERGDRVPMEARHICLLFKRFRAWDRDVTRPYVEAMEARDVKHVLVGGHSFHQRDEVLALRNALTAIEWPDDELSVFATLRGPLFAVTDDALLAYRHHIGGLHPLRPFDDAEKAALSETVRPVLEALEVLRDLHRRRNRRPAADTLSSLLEATRAHAGLACWQGGEQALANVLRVQDLARRFEGQGATSFRAFVEWLRREAERGGGAADAPVVEEGTDGVRIMTVHKAKGLEFPVVVLCDPMAQRSPDRGGSYVDHEAGMWAGPLAGCRPQDLTDNEEAAREQEAAEGIRVGYVAATRARDLLIVPVCGDEPLTGWTDVLNPALYPEFGQHRNPALAQGCPEFGDVSVVERPPKVRVTPGSSVRPGLHRPRTGDHRVVWWDPMLVAGRVKSTGGLRHQAILEAPDLATLADEGNSGEASHAAWMGRRRQAVNDGTIPTVVAITATAAAHGAPASPEVVAAIQIEQVSGRDLTRPHGKRFGILVHAVLADIHLGATVDEVDALTTLQARALRADDQERQAAATVVSAALQHPLMQRAAASDRCLRETPIVLPREDGTLVEGIVDLAFLEGEGDDCHWEVVDFKSDLALSGDSTAAYAAQVTLYAEAIHAATGQPTRGVLLVV